MGYNRPARRIGVSLVWRAGRGEEGMGGYLAVMGVCLLGLLYLFLTAPNILHPKARTRMLGGWLYAHRGLHGGDIPENSLPAFTRAAEKGYGMELDVHLTKDGHMVVHHDDSLLRLCGVNRRIGDMTLQEVRACRFIGTDLPVPTLDEALDTVQGKTPLIIELKSAGDDWKRLPEKLYRRMRAYAGIWCVESFDPRMLRWFKRYAGHVIRGQLAYDPARLPGDDHRGFRYWCCARLLMNFLSRPDFISYGYETAGNLSFRMNRFLFEPVLAAWTVRSQEDLEKLKQRYLIQIFEAFEP